LDDVSMSKIKGHQCTNKLGRIQVFDMF